MLDGESGMINFVVVDGARSLFESMLHLTANGEMSRSGTARNSVYQSSSSSNNASISNPFSEIPSNKVEATLALSDADAM
jgi:hypothetical protein